MKNGIYKSLTLFLLIGLLFAQFRVSGTVTDATSGDYLARAFVFIEGSKVIAKSDEEGNFHLEIPNELTRAKISTVSNGYNSSEVFVETSGKNKYLFKEIVLNILLDPSTTKNQKQLNTQFNTALTPNIPLTSIPMLQCEVVTENISRLLQDILNIDRIHVLPTHSGRVSFVNSIIVEIDGDPIDLSEINFFGDHPYAILANALLMDLAFGDREPLMHFICTDNSQGERGFAPCPDPFNGPCT